MTDGDERAEATPSAGVVKEEAAAAGGGGQGETPLAAGGVREVVVVGGPAGLAQEITVGPHRLKADEPVAVGGTDTGPTPYDLLAAALGACTSMTIALYAHRKAWPLEGVTVRLKHAKIHAVDCEECETREGRIDRIEREIELRGALTAEQRARLMEIADKCPVHRTLTSEVDIRTCEIQGAPPL